MDGKWQGFKGLLYISLLLMSFGFTVAKTQNVGQISDSVFEDHEEKNEKNISSSSKRNISEPTLSKGKETFQQETVEKMPNDQGSKDVNEDTGCFDWQGRLVKNGAKYIPNQNDMCVECTCDKRFPIACTNIACSAPDYCKNPQVVPDTCCDWKCSDDSGPKDNRNTTDNGSGSTNSGSTDSITNLSLRLTASAVTSFLVLALLLFMVHRLRQRRLLLAMRRFEARARQTHDDLDSDAYIPDSFLTLECPPYTDPPPPYSPPKPPQIMPGEQPPPYEEINQNGERTNSGSNGVTREGGGAVTAISAAMSQRGGSTQRVPALGQSGRLHQVANAVNTEAQSRGAESGHRRSRSEGVHPPSTLTAYASTDIVEGLGVVISPSAGSASYTNPGESWPHSRRSTMPHAGNERQLPDGANNHSNGQGRNHPTDRTRDSRGEARVQTLPTTTAFQRFSNIFRRDSSKSKNRPASECSAPPQYSTLPRNENNSSIDSSRDPRARRAPYTSRGFSGRLCMSYDSSQDGYTLAPVSPSTSSSSSTVSCEHLANTPHPLTQHLNSPAAFPISSHQQSHNTDNGSVSQRQQFHEDLCRHLPPMQGLEDPPALDTIPMEVLSPSSIPTVMSQSVPPSLSSQRIASYKSYKSQPHLGVSSHNAQQQSGRFIHPPTTVDRIIHSPPSLDRTIQSPDSSARSIHSPSSIHSASAHSSTPHPVMVQAPLHYSSAGPTTSPQSQSLASFICSHPSGSVHFDRNSPHTSSNVQSPETQTSYLSSATSPETHTSFPSSAHSPETLSSHISNTTSPDTVSSHLSWSQQDEAPARSRPTTQHTDSVQRNHFSLTHHSAQSPQMSYSEHRALQQTNNAESPPSPQGATAALPYTSAMHRSLSGFSQGSTFSVCSETGEKRLSRGQNQETRVLSSDSPYPDHPSLSHPAVKKSEDKSFHPLSTSELQDTGTSLYTLSVSGLNELSPHLSQPDHQGLNDLDAPGTSVLPSSHSSVLAGKTISASENLNSSAYTKKGPLGSKEVTPMLVNKDNVLLPSSSSGGTSLECKTSAAVCEPKEENNGIGRQGDKSRKIKKRKSKDKHNPSPQFTSTSYKAKHVHSPKYLRVNVQDKTKDAGPSKTDHVTSAKETKSKVTSKYSDRRRKDPLGTSRPGVRFSDSYGSGKVDPTAYGNADVYRGIELSSFHSGPPLPVDSCHAENPWDPTELPPMGGQDSVWNDLNQPTASQDNKGLSRTTQSCGSNLPATDQCKLDAGSVSKKKHSHRRQSGSVDRTSSSPSRHKTRPKSLAAPMEKVSEKHRLDQLPHPYVNTGDHSFLSKGARSGFGHDLNFDNESGGVDLYSAHFDLSRKRMSFPYDLQQQSTNGNGKNAPRVDLVNSEPGVSTMNVKASSRSGLSNDLSFVNRAAVVNGGTKTKKRQSLPALICSSVQAGPPSANYDNSLQSDGLHVRDDRTNETTASYV